MDDFKILVLPGRRGGLNIPVAVQSSLCRYYLKDVYGREAMPVCEVAYNPRLPKLVQLVDSLVCPVLIVVTTKLMFEKDAAGAIRKLASTKNGADVTLGFVMEREECTLREFSLTLDSQCTIQQPEVLDLNG